MCVYTQLIIVLKMKSLLGMFNTQLDLAKEFNELYNQILKNYPKYREM